MITIITPTQFKSIPWKNGKGDTTELAINEGGTLNNFDWRLSMASVVEDGQFSNFSGYTRNLILIEGNGINLQHDHNKIDKLAGLLDIATFDGSSETLANLVAGPITDFNIIVCKDKYEVIVSTYNEKQTIKLKSADLCFIFALSGEICLSALDGSAITILPHGDLLQISQNHSNNYKLNGQQMIVAYLKDINS